MMALRRYGLLVLLCVTVFVGTAALSFALTYDWRTYYEVKEMRQARGSDYTIWEVLGDTLKDMP